MQTYFRADFIHGTAATLPAQVATDLDPSRFQGTQADHNLQALEGAARLARETVGVLEGLVVAMQNGKLSVGPGTALEKDGRILGLSTEGNFLLGAAPGLPVGTMNQGWAEIDALVAG